MSSEGIVQLIFTAFVGSGISALMWHRLNQIETRLEGTARREDVELLRQEIHAEIGSLRQELHEETRAVRSDLTQVALAVGARRPQASQG